MRQNSIEPHIHTSMWKTNYVCILANTVSMSISWSSYCTLIIQEVNQGGKGRWRAHRSLYYFYNFLWIYNYFICMYIYDYFKMKSKNKTKQKTYRALTTSNCFWQKTCHFWPWLSWGSGDKEGSAPTEWRFNDDIRELQLALAGLAQWTECRPANQMVASLIPSPGTCLGCGLGPQCRVRERQPHIGVSLSLSPSLPLSLKINKIF